MNSFNWYDQATTTSSTTTTTQQEPLNLEKLKAAIESIGPEPFREFMCSKGMPPEEGYRLVLPTSLKEECGPFMPSYVGFADIETPCIYMDVTQWLRTAK